MRRKSPKARAADKAAKAFLCTITRCELCRKRVATDCHEIARGIHRMRARGQRMACLGLCRTCHDEMDSRAQWPVSRQLWLLKRSRPHDYSLERFLAAFHPNAPRAITTTEVDYWEHMQWQT